MSTQELLRDLKEAESLDVSIEIKIVDGPLFLAETMRWDDGYIILMSEEDPYLLHHEFYHILVEERLAKPRDKTTCDYCTKIFDEMLNAATDILVERRVYDTDPQLFTTYYPTITEDLKRSIRSGTISFDPTRSIAYFLYLQAAINSMYPHLELGIWGQMTLPPPVSRRIESALLLLDDLCGKRMIQWGDLRDTAIYLSRELFDAKPMIIEGPNGYLLRCITDHNRAKYIVEALHTGLRGLTDDARGHIDE